MSKQVHTEGCRLGTERCSRKCRTVYEAKDVVLKIRHTDGTETVIKNFGHIEHVDYDYDVHYELTRHDTLALTPNKFDIYDGRGEKP